MSKTFSPYARMSAPLPLPKSWPRRSSPFTIVSRGVAVLRDNGVRSNQTLEALAKLRPVFEPETGTVTAGNSSQITDGAVALLVGTASIARELNLEPLGIIRDFAYAGCDPKRMGLGPVYAVDRLLKRSHLSLGDADLIEINEAFAAQVLAVLRELKTIGVGEVPDEKLNVNGGAIALGHPVGASGARLVLTALKQLRRSGGQTGPCHLVCWRRSGSRALA